MIFDGNKHAGFLAEKIKQTIASLHGKVQVVVIAVGATAVTKSYIEKKQHYAQSVGIVLRIDTFSEAVSQVELLAHIQALNSDKGVSGIVVQLPLPAHIQTEAVLRMVNPHKDIDGLGAQPLVLPPVVGAIEYILDAQGYNVLGKQATVIGKGRLVGVPAALWLKARGAHVKIVTKETGDLSESLVLSDIIVSGAGVPDLIRKEMLTKGVVLLDAGASEEGGRVRGDASPDCASVTSLFTPVPGGIGPITVAYLFYNALHLVAHNGAHQ